MTFKLGLTGSIGMGKSTTADLFREAGCAVWDADAAVHRLYDRGGAAVGPVARALPGTVVDGAVSREALKRMISDDQDVLKILERIVHPLVAEDRAAFVARTDADIVVFDIPLLFETGGDRAMDATAVVTIDAETQEARVLARGTMTRSDFERIRDKQMPDAEKRARADHVIVTDTPEHARAQVEHIVDQIRKGRAHA